MVASARGVHKNSTRKIRPVDLSNFNRVLKFFLKNWVGYLTLLKLAGSGSGNGSIAKLVPTKFDLFIYFLKYYEFMIFA